MLSSARSRLSTLRTPRRSRLLAALGAVGVLAAAVVAIAPQAQVDCAPGTTPLRRGQEVPPDLRVHLGLPQTGELDLPAGTCIPAFWGVEPRTELAQRDREFGGMFSSPYATVAPGAIANASAQRQAFLQDEGAALVPGADGAMEVYSQGPLIFDDDRFESSNTGIVDSGGRIDDFHYDEPTNRLFAAIGTGGVWLSEDLGATFRPITDNLPTTVASAVSYSPNGGPDGTVVVLTGEHTYGGGSYLGLGAFWSDDLGATWRRASGPLDATFGFAIEVDPANADIVYAATGKGLWRSTDAGRTYTDAVLPTGDCAGDYNLETCLFANFVTDVVVKAPGGVGADTEGSDVVAAVGWRAGTMTNPDGSIQSADNGLYHSATGEPGSFTPLSGLADAAGGQPALGRIELGPAVGAEQDHDILYAIVEDAELFNGGPVLEPLPQDTVDSPIGTIDLSATVLNGIYYSADFGVTWTQLADDIEMASVCPVNQSVFCIPGLVTPGVQAWYNMWIAPDPTRQVGGIPTRVALGLEEVWQNRETQVPAATPVTSFEVFGAYYGTIDCLLVATNCTTNSVLGLTTTHPDQHDGIWIPDGEGGAKLFVGHDGGISAQTLAPGEELSQRTWELEQENGLQTLLPYSSVWANDGVAYAGLQDNGHMRLDPAEGNAQYETFGADGTFAAVDPENSDYAIESTQNNGMNVTTNGGVSWTSIDPFLENVRFVNPFVMDPLDSNRIMTGGSLIVQSADGPNTATGTGESWMPVFDLGTTDADPLVETEAPAPPNQQTAMDLYGDGAYVAFCGPCDILNTAYPFTNGIATNIGAGELPAFGTEAGWHVAAAEGLPNRQVTSLAIDPYDASQRTVFATLGGYSRAWVPPGALFHEPTDVGEGHVYVSRDAGETFTDISGNLPDMPVLWVEPRGDQLLIGTQLGAFISSDTDGGPWSLLGGEQLPAVPVTSIQLKPDDPDRALIGTYGRSLWTYQFPPATGPSVERLAGASRIETAVAIAQETFTSADTVVLARADVYADALAGAPLAYREDAPLLLSNTDALPPVVADEVGRLGARRAILLGGTAALSPAVEDALRAAGVTEIERFSGANRFGTAGAISAELGGTAAFLVKGNDADPARGWPDAMSIAPVAARLGQPILLTETDLLPQETADAAGALDLASVRVVGGALAVADSVAQELADGAGATLGPRIAGSNRFETSVAAALVGEQEAGMSARRLFTARGGAFADALTGGPAVAAVNGLLVLVDDTELDNSPSTRDFVASRACQVRALRVLGGVDAISQGVEDALRGLLSGCPPPGELLPPPAPAPVAGDVPVEGPVTGVTFAGPFGFEADSEGWTEQITIGAGPSMWSIGDGGHESEQSEQVIPYDDLAQAFLESPVFESPAGNDLAVRFWMTLDTESGFDELRVELSTDDGGTYTTLATYSGQNVDYPEFSEEVVEFSASGPFRLRFTLFSDEVCSSAPVPELCVGGAGYEGVRVDDIEVLELG